LLRSKQKLPQQEHLNRLVGEFVRPGPPPLRVEQTVWQALEAIRATGLEERIFYFYVVDAAGCLSGVVPARKLLTEPLERPIGEVMIRRILSLPESATLLEACECFILHKFLAIPVVDSAKHLRGIIDVGLFTDEFTFRNSSTPPPGRPSESDFHGLLPPFLAACSAP
jgi:magnesium transporter